MGCGRVRPKAELKRFVLDGRHPREDQKGPGRGVYLCPDPGCREAAEQNRGFNRSFRAQVELIESSN
ncbi:MAG: YlxR family protein [Thermoleophilaceae bacterium]|nr:YlxR family protein [Thermoleophilaceae bacterium]